MSPHAMRVSSRAFGESHRHGVLAVDQLGQAKAQFATALLVPNGTEVFCTLAFSAATGRTVSAPRRDFNAVQLFYSAPNGGCPVTMVISGATVDDRLVLALARAVDHPGLANKLSLAHRFRSEVVNLNSSERALVLRALERGSLELQALHAELAAHPAWRSAASHH